MVKFLCRLRRSVVVRYAVAAITIVCLLLNAEWIKSKTIKLAPTNELTFHHYAITGIRASATGDNINQIETNVKRPLSRFKKDMETPRRRLVNLDSLQKANNDIGKFKVKPPDISDVIKHFKKRRDAFEPAVKFSRDRYNVTLVIGIPVVDRKIAFYLNKTLDSLVKHLSPKDAEDCIVTVLFCDYNHDYNVRTAVDIARTFPSAVKSGLLELLVVPQEFYPNLRSQAATADRNGDSIERWLWRTKENLDAAFLMQYAYLKAKFYLMMEDDVIAKPGYLPKVKNFALQSEDRNWIYLRYSDFGSKGILIRNTYVPSLIYFLLTFYTTWPIDWLMDNFLLVWVCKKDIYDGCVAKKSELRLEYPERLFFHIGHCSSLKEKWETCKNISNTNS